MGRLPGGTGWVWGGMALLWPLTMMAQDASYMSPEALQRAKLHAHLKVVRPPDPYKPFEVGFYYRPTMVAGEVDALRERLSEQLAVTNAAFARAGVTHRAAISFLEPWPYHFVDAEEINALYALLDDHSQELALRHLDGTETDAVFLVTDTIKNGPTGWAVIAHPGAYEDVRGDVMLFGALFTVMSDTLLAHELGHMLGMLHDKANAGILPDYLERDAHGYACPANGVQNGTIMSYTTPNHHFFSTPDIVREGLPCGVLGEANNSRVLRLNLPKAVNAKTGVSVLSLASLPGAPLRIEENAGRIDIRIRRDKTLKQGSLLLRFKEDSGQDFDPREPKKMLHFPVGVAEASVHFSIVQDSSPEPTKTYTLEVLEGINVRTQAPSSFSIVLEDQDAVAKPPAPPAKSGGGGVLPLGVLLVSCCAWWRRQSKNASKPVRNLLGTNS